MTETKNNTQNKIDEKHQEALDLMIKREELLASSARKGLREARAINEGIFKAKEKILTVERQILKDAIAEGKVLSKTQVKKKAVMEGGKGAVKQGLGLTEGDKIFSGRGLANMLGKGLQGAMHVAGAATENPLFNLGANALGQRSSRIDAARENVYQEDQSKLNSSDDNDTEETETKQQSGGGDGDGGDLKALAQTRNDILLKGFGMMPTSGQFEEFNDNLIDLNEIEGNILENAEEQLEDKKLENDDVKKTETKPGALAKVQKDNKKADKEDKEGGTLDNAADMLMGMNALKTMLSTGPLITLLGVAGPLALAVAGIAAFFGGVDFLESWQKGMTEERDNRIDDTAHKDAQKTIDAVLNSDASVEEKQTAMDQTLEAKEAELKRVKEEAGLLKSSAETEKIETLQKELGLLKAGRKDIQTPEEKDAKEASKQKEFERVYKLRKESGYDGEGTEDYERRKKIKEDAKKAEVPLAAPEPVKTEPVKTEPVKTEPVKTEPVKTEPVKAKKATAAKPPKRATKKQSLLDRIDKELDIPEELVIPDEFKDQHKDDEDWWMTATDAEIDEDDKRRKKRDELKKKYKEDNYEKDDFDNFGDDSIFDDFAKKNSAKNKNSKTTSTSSKKVTETVTGGKEHVTVRSHEKYAPTLDNGGIDPTTGEKSVWAYDRQYGDKDKKDLYKSRKSRFDEQWNEIKDTDGMKGASKKDRLHAMSKIRRSIRDEDKQTLSNKRDTFLKNAKEHGGNYAYSEAGKEAERAKNQKENGNQAVVIPAPAAAPAPAAPKPSGGGNISTSDNHNFGNKLMDNM